MVIRLIALWLVNTSQKVVHAMDQWWLQRNG